MSRLYEEIDDLSDDIAGLRQVLSHTEKKLTEAFERVTQIKDLLSVKESRLTELTLAVEDSDESLAEEKHEMFHKRHQVSCKTDLLDKLQPRPPKSIPKKKIKHICNGRLTLRRFEN